MKRSAFRLGILAVFFLISLFCGSSFFAEEKEQAPPPDENFYSKSLHYTNKGIEYLYSKETGGVERITGITAADMGCMKAKCHVSTCDTCHKKEADGKAYYSTERALAQQACDKCHPVAKDDPDVHFSKGMKCVDCHSSREIHGDGIAHKTYMEPGFFDTKCEKCHDAISQNPSHTIHKGKLDCSTCHVKEMSMCVNCHYGARMKDQTKDYSIMIKGTYCLINHDGKVKLANLLTHVYENKTMITFAPYFPHSVTREAKRCKDCHNTVAIEAIKKNKFRLLEWTNGEMKSYQGFVPVLDGMKWDLIFFDYKDGKWVPLEKPEQPLLNYSGYCTPLTKEQFSKLEAVK